MLMAIFMLTLHCEYELNLKKKQPMEIHRTLLIALTEKIR